MGTDRNDNPRKKRNFEGILNLLCVLLTVFLLVGLVCRIFGDHTETPYIFGYRIGIVVSDSMEPAIPIYSLIVEKQVFTEDVFACGDIVSYYHECSDGKKMRITHRIVKMHDGLIYTKGDHNDSLDAYPLTKSMIESSVVCIFPYFIDGLAALTCMVCCGLIFKSYKCIKGTRPNAT